MSQEEIILSQSEYESLLEEVHRLQARISELTALRDDLIYHICPALQAEYYGMYITSVNSIKADDGLKTYWAVYVNGEYGQYGVDFQPSNVFALQPHRVSDRILQDDIKRVWETTEYTVRWRQAIISWRVPLQRIFS